MKIFITATGTNVGKTYATAFLAKHYRQKSKKVITQKFVQTGCEGISEDIIMHRKLMGMDLLKEDLDFTTCEYVFKFPASAHLASALENVEIDIEKISQATAKLAQKYDVVLIEGAGGIMVPITEDFLTIDYIKKENLPIALVVASHLGSLNHALLTLEICRLNGVDLKYLIYNNFEEVDEKIVNSTKQYLKKYIKKHYPSAEFLELEKS